VNLHVEWSLLIPNLPSLGSFCSLGFKKGKVHNSKCVYPIPFHSKQSFTGHPIWLQIRECPGWMESTDTKFSQSRLILFSKLKKTQEKQPVIAETDGVPLLQSRRCWSVHERTICEAEVERIPQVRLIDAHARIARRISVYWRMACTWCPYSTNYQKWPSCADTGCSAVSNGCWSIRREFQCFCHHLSPYLSPEKRCTVIIVPRSLATQHSTAIAIGITTYTPSSGFSPQTRCLFRTL